MQGTDVSATLGPLCAYLSAFCWHLHRGDPVHRDQALLLSSEHPAAPMDTLQPVGSPVTPLPEQRQFSCRVYISPNLQRFKCGQLCPSDHLLESFSLEPTSFLKGMGIYEHGWVTSHRQVSDRTLSSVSLQVTYLGVLSPFCATLPVSHSHSPFLLMFLHPNTFI